MRAIILGICAAFFFAVTFVVNRAMDLSGGSWIWSASLRYFFMVPFLLAIVSMRGTLGVLFAEMRRNPAAWMMWSTIGFGLFYAPLTFAASYGPGWLIAGTWQITIVSGSLLAPFFYEKIQTASGMIRKRGRIPLTGLAMSGVILCGVVLMQAEHAGGLSSTEMLFGVVPVIIASFAYPLGNRKMMELCEGRLDVYARVLGMTLASLPFWFLLAAYGWAIDGLPQNGQVAQSFVVAVSSGVIATILFFKATDLVRGDMGRLAAVEATQAGEVLFAVAGEVFWLAAPVPSAMSWAGMLLVAVGMMLHSYVSHKKPKAAPQILEV